MISETGYAVASVPYHESPAGNLDYFWKYSAHIHGLEIECSHPVDGCDTDHFLSGQHKLNS